MVPSEPDLDSKNLIDAEAIQPSDVQKYKISPEKYQAKAKEAEKEANVEAKCCKAYFAKHPRQQFLIKVYSVLSCMLTFTAGCVFVVVYDDRVNKYLKARGWIAFSFVGAVMLGMFLHSCCLGFFRESPMNYVLLVYFTLAWSGMVAGFCAFSTPKVVLLAASMTALMTIGLSLIALCIQREMTWCYGLGATVLLATWPAIIFAVLDPGYTRTSIMAFFGTMIASCYIVIDTAKVMAAYGKSDEYIIGTLALYRDILVLFLSLLTILGQSSR